MFVTEYVTKSICLPTYINYTLLYASHSGWIFPLRGYALGPGSSPGLVSGVLGRYSLMKKKNLKCTKEHMRFQCN